MRCPACSSDNVEDAAFCRSCGVPLASANEPAAATHEGDPPGAVADDGDKLMVPATALVALMAIIIVGVVAFLAFRGGGDAAPAGQRYPQEVRDNFMRSCTAQGAPSATCFCMIEALEERISIDEFTDLESRLGQQDELPPVFVEAVTSCA